MELYRTVAGEGTGRVEEKKSVFIASIRPAQSEDEALAFIAGVRKKYWDARHNCYAYIIGTEKPIERSSDDGEPSRTAGLPMLEVLKGAGLYNVVVVVTRYFGGTLLGTGGLIRAYSEAVKSAIEDCEPVTMRLYNRLTVDIDYNGYGRLTRMLGQPGLLAGEVSFTDRVTAVVFADDAHIDGLRTALTEVSAGKCVIEIVGKEYVADGF